MYSNCNCTLYRRNGNDSYVRIVLTDVYWEDCRRVARSKAGARADDTALLLIPMTKITRPQCESDYFIKGEVNQEVSGQPGYTLADLMRSHDVKTVVSCDARDMGSPEMQHWEVGLQ